MENPSLRTNKGFTLLEMTVVVTLLALFAALIVPNVTSEKAGREARQFFPKVRNLMLEARGRSIVDGATRIVRLDESGGRVVVERAGQDTGQDIGQEPTEATEERTLSLPEGVTGSAFRVEKEESTSAEWDIRFYTDGKAKAGGISFSNNGRIQSIVADQSGRVEIIDGPLPDASDEKWDAGGFEQRV